jgi:tryptophanyl-tRNA synthetase
MAQVYSGIQPSGELHIGNYLGAVKNWVALQGEHPGAIFCVVTYHALTGTYDPDVLRRRTHEMALSLLAAGIDPRRATLYLQSDVPEHTELAWIFNTVTPLGELERQTQYKDKASRQESVPVGVLTYPVLQAADILLYRADAVPVGEDQVQHLELSREIARKWNARFAPEDRPYFPEPRPLLTPSRRIMGLDGQAKMSKSMGNTVGLLESPDGDLGEAAAGDDGPGAGAQDRPRHARGVQHLPPAQGFSAEPVVAEVADRCRTAGWGCIECKRVLHASMDEELTPIRGRAAALRAEPGQVADALAEGAERCRTVARETMREVRGAMGLG